MLLNYFSKLITQRYNLKQYFPYITVYILQERIALQKMIAIVIVM